MRDFLKEHGWRRHWYSLGSLSRFILGLWSPCGKGQVQLQPLEAERGFASASSCTGLPQLLLARACVVMVRLGYPHRRMRLLAGTTSRNYWEYSRIVEGFGQPPSKAFLQILLRLTLQALFYRFVHTHNSYKRFKHDSICATKRNKLSLQKRPCKWHIAMRQWADCRGQWR